jgi:murein DD-endopeptidase MepM/ murein hydrolase activator NlpD
VSFVGYQAKAAGYWVLEHAADGRDFFFAHCQAGSTVVAQGQAVAAGAPLCRVGHTGDATGPHLHFEIWVGGWHAGPGAPIDPLPQLRRWES